MKNNSLNVKSRKDENLTNSIEIIYLINTINNICYIINNNKIEEKHIITPYRIRTFVRSENIVFIKKISKNSPIDICLIIKDNAPFFEILNLVVFDNLSNDEINRLIQLLLNSNKDYQSVIKALRYINKIFIFSSGIC
jgi:hypothetical protein